MIVMEERRNASRQRPVISSPHAENDSRYVITAVFTQVFDYMIETGMEYAYVNTGMACAFFQNLEAEPTVLYYSLHVPTGPTLRRLLCAKLPCFSVAASR
jgi:hypothetical protein